MAADGNQVLVYAVRCPIGGCSKKGGLFGKKATAEEAQQAVKHHLLKSPYHELDEETATRMAEEYEAECWLEEVSEPVPEDDSAEWFDARKRQRTALAIGARARPRWQHAGGAAGSSSGVTLRTVGEAATDTITLSRVQIQAMADSLRRAHTAAESAATLASRASRAFGEEARVIYQCQQVLESYL